MRLKVRLPWERRPHKSLTLIFGFWRSISLIYWFLLISCYALNLLCVFRMPWVLHQMPGRDPIPVSYCYHPAVRGCGPVLWLWTRGPLWHRHHPPELLWGCSEPCGCTWRLHYVSLERLGLNQRVYHWPHGVYHSSWRISVKFITCLLDT